MTRFWDEISARLATLTGSATPEETRQALNEFDTRDIQAVRVSEGGGGGVSTPAVLRYADFLFTEEATAGTYTATLAIPAGTLVAGSGVYTLGAIDPGNTGWAADTALLTIGDGTNASGYRDGEDLLPAVTVYDPLADPSSIIDGNGYVGQGVNNSPAEYSTKNFVGEGASGGGIFYDSSDTITIEIVTTIAVPPVTPGGITLVRIWYFTPRAAPVDADFS